MKRGKSTKEPAAARTGFRTGVTKLVLSTILFVMGYFIARLLWRGVVSMGRTPESGLGERGPGGGEKAPGVREHTPPTEDSTQLRAQVWAEEARRTPLNQGEERSFQE